MNHVQNKWRPGAGTATGRVWEIADELTRQLGRMPKGPEVVAVYTAEGGNPNTGQTQFHHWKKAQDASPPRPVATVDPPDRQSEPVTGWLDVTAQGQLVLPMALREAMRLNDARKVRAEVVDGELRLTSPSVALDQARAIFRSFDTVGGSLVDELIRERRYEAERE